MYSCMVGKNTELEDARVRLEEEKSWLSERYEELKLEQSSLLKEHSALREQSEQREQEAQQEQEALREHSVVKEQEVPVGQEWKEDKEEGKNELKGIEAEN
jgi:peptidoglycan hydrolase CwlO-like protein